jgi:hypothetical protein
MLENRNNLPFLSPPLIILWHLKTSSKQHLTMTFCLHNIDKDEFMMPSTKAIPLNKILQEFFCRQKSSTEDETFSSPFVYFRNEKKYQSFYANFLVILDAHTRNKDLRDGDETDDFMKSFRFNKTSL